MLVTRQLTVDIAFHRETNGSQWLPSTTNILQKMFLFRTKELIQVWNNIKVN